MANPWTKEQRSRAMSRVKNMNTKPEVQVRSMLHRMGYRFRLHRRDLPGAPDVVLPRYRQVVFVHGCFWHNHDCPRGKRPSTRTEFWNAKLDTNIERDRANRKALEERGWQVLTVWECELKDLDAVREKLRHFMEDNAPKNRMARRTQSGNSEEFRRRLIDLLDDFEHRLEEDDLREQVRALVPAVHLLRDLGSSLVPEDAADSARDRILYYLRRYPLTVIAGDELGVVSGISEYARRIRELRVQFGWPIYSGQTAKEMLEEEEDADSGNDLFGPELPASTIRSMKTDDYVLIGDQDREAAYRWNVANTIRKLNIAVQDRILLYLRKNVEHPVTGEELRYVAKNATEWGRRTRELRTEEGWPVATRSSGRPDLPIGVYVLEADRQSPPHDRNISDKVRLEVMQRDHFGCRCCGWDPVKRKPGDPRALLELHHIDHHVSGGSNEADNLITLCNVHHDEVHRQKVNGREQFFDWLRGTCE